MLASKERHEITGTQWFEGILSKLTSNTSCTTFTKETKTASTSTMVIETISASFSSTLIIANNFVDCKKKEA
jgi:hypothetical protein